MMRIAVCDDDRCFATRLEEMVLQEALQAGISAETEVYSDGDTLVTDLQKGYRYELIFLDIEMKRINGIKAAHAIRGMDRSVLLIYVSGYEQYLKELFEVEPFRFLQKPLNDSKFRRYFHEACDRIGDMDSFNCFSTSFSLP